MTLNRVFTHTHTHTGIRTWQKKSGEKWYIKNQDEYMQWTQNENKDRGNGMRVVVNRKGKVIRVNGQMGNGQP